MRPRRPLSARFAFLLSGGSAALTAFEAMAPHRDDGSPDDLMPLARHLSSAGLRTETVALPTFIAGVDEQARWLNAVVDAMDNSDPVLLVAHSMGGLVVQYALADEAEWMNRRSVAGTETPF